MRQKFCKTTPTKIGETDFGHGIPESSQTKLTGRHVQLRNHSYCVNRWPAVTSSYCDGVAGGFDARASDNDERHKVLFYRFR